MLQSHVKFEYISIMYAVSCFTSARGRDREIEIDKEKEGGGGQRRCNISTYNVCSKIPRRENIYSS